jgi:hypothetical protein
MSVIIFVAVLFGGAGLALAGYGGEAILRQVWSRGETPVNVKVVIGAGSLILIGLGIAIPIIGGALAWLM